jgi:hypothetical protein
LSLSAPEETPWQPWSRALAHPCSTRLCVRICQTGPRFSRMRGTAICMPRTRSLLRCGVVWSGVLPMRRTSVPPIPLHGGFPSDRKSNSRRVVTLPCMSRPSWGTSSARWFCSSAALTRVSRHSGIHPYLLTRCVPFLSARYVWFSYPFLLYCTVCFRKSTSYLRSGFLFACQCVSPRSPAIFAPDWPNAAKISPLWAALCSSQKEMAAVLLDAGADPKV